MKRLLAAAFVALAAHLAIAWQPARADTIRIGFTISTTGPAASLGIPQQKSVALMPHEIGGDTIEYTVLDDGGDATRAVANLRKLVDENHVDVVVGSSVTPAALAMIGVAAEKQVPMLALAASAAIITPVDAEKRWVFKLPQNDSLMADAIADHMAKANIHTVAFIGFNDAYGDGWLTEFTRATQAREIKLASIERYSRSDTSVMGQVLKTIGVHPDAVLIAGSGTPAALPEKTLRERGFTAPIYQTHGVANADFLRVGGRDVEGTILPVGPVLVAAQLPDGNPIKPVALDYVQRYEAANGPGTAATFGAHAWDAMLLLERAIPVARQAARPGTPEFHAALRDSLEQVHEVVETNGVASMSPRNHNGFDERARVMVTIRNGAWQLLP